MKEPTEVADGLAVEEVVEVGMRLWPRVEVLSWQMSVWSSELEMRILLSQCDNLP